jgi:hypothetical protein
MRHLWRSTDEVWCDADAFIKSAVNDPYDADCAECLRYAATYGAKAAMRGAAVEALPERDEEVEQERDHAIVELDKLRGILGQHDLFACAGCSRLFHVDLVRFHVGLMAWCGDCTAARGRIL